MLSNLPYFLFRPSTVDFYNWRIRIPVGKPLHHARSVSVSVCVLVAPYVIDSLVKSETPDWGYLVTTLLILILLANRGIPMGLGNKHQQYRAWENSGILGERFPAQERRRSQKINEKRDCVSIVDNFPDIFPSC